MNAETLYFPGDSTPNIDLRLDRLAEPMPVACISLEESGMRAPAEFAAFTDLKVKWVRTSDWAEFRVSDYLRDAPEGVIENLARTIMARIRGCGGDYTDRATAWLTAPEFSETHRPVYLERDERAGSREGEHKSIGASLGRLEGLGLIGMDPSIEIRWSREEERGTRRGPRS